MIGNSQSTARTRTVTAKVGLQSACTASMETERRVRMRPLRLGQRRQYHSLGITEEAGVIGAEGGSWKSDHFLR